MTARQASAGDTGPGRTWSLRTVLVTSLLVFSIVPAATVGWFLYRSNLQSVQTLAEKTVEATAQRVQIVTEEHVSQAHVVLNGLIHEQPGEAAVARARQLIQNPALFEQTAFAMTRMTPRVPHHVFGHTPRRIPGGRGAVPGGQSTHPGGGAQRRRAGPHFFCR
jgi:hypothetical protein